MQKKIQGLKARAISKNKRIMGRAFSPRNIFGLVSLGVAQGYYGSRRWRWTDLTAKYGHACLRSRVFCLF